LFLIANINLHSHHLRRTQSRLIIYYPEIIPQKVPRISQFSPRRRHSIQEHVSTMRGRFSRVQTLRCQRWSVMSKMSKDRRSVRKVASILCRSRNANKALIWTRGFAVSQQNRRIRGVSVLTLRGLAELFIETRERAGAPLSFAHSRSAFNVKSQRSPCRSRTVFGEFLSTFTRANIRSIIRYRVQYTFPW